MRPSEVRPAVEQWLRDAYEASELQVEELHPPDHVSNELSAAWRAEKYAGADADELEGVIPLDCVIRLDRSSPRTRVPLLLKARTGAGLGRTALPHWFEQAGIRLTRPLEDYGSLVEFLDSRDREIGVYRLQQRHEAFRRYMPCRIGDRVRPDADEYLLLVERVDDAALMDSGDDITGWTASRIATMIDAVAAQQAPWLGRTGELGDASWPAHCRDAAVTVRDRELWQELVDAGRRNLPAVVTPEIHKRCSKLVDTIDEWYPPRDQLPSTLVHDDLNPRNACFRADGRPLVYDWELALIDVPQRDLAELLTFVLDPAREPTLGRDAVAELVERHRTSLARASGVDLEPEHWWEGFRIAVRLEAINRVPYQWLLGTVIELGYVDRITKTVQHLLRSCC